MLDMLYHTLLSLWISTYILITRHMKTLSNSIKSLIKIILKNYISNTVHELSFESCLDFKIGIYLISSYVILYMCIILLHSLFIYTLHG